MFAHVGVSEEVFANDMNNLEIAVISNLPHEVTCECEGKFVIHREFGSHLFVEVSFNMPLRLIDKY